MKKILYYQLNLFGEQQAVYISGRKVYLKPESFVTKKKPIVTYGQLHLDFTPRRPDVAALIPVNYKALQRCALSLTKHAENAEDLLQDAIVTMLEKQQQYKEQDKFTGWACRIIRNTFLNNVSKIKNRNERYGYTTELPDYYGEEYVEEHAIKEQKGIDSALMDAINGVDVIYRNIVILTAQGFKYEEIATLENIPVGTVRSRLHLARQILQEKLVK